MVLNGWSNVPGLASFPCLTVQQAHGTPRTLQSRRSAERRPGGSKSAAIRPGRRLYRDRRGRGFRCGRPGHFNNDEYADLAAFDHFGKITLRCSISAQLRHLRHGGGAAPAAAGGERADRSALRALRAPDRRPIGAGDPAAVQGSADRGAQRKHLLPKCGRHGG
jgi:hypothetical protein